MRDRYRLLFFGVIILIMAALEIRACIRNHNAATEQRIVAIAPLGDFHAKAIPSLCAEIEKYYGCKTVVLDAMEIPDRFIVRIKKPRYRADSIIRYLREIKPDSITNILGFTHHDISTTKYDENGSVKTPSSKYSDWGIFGLGYRPGVSCVVSDFRLKAKSEAKTKERLIKVCLHELGHNFGLEHCENPKCFMQDAAESIRTVDKCGYELCQKCKGKVF